MSTVCLLYVFCMSTVCLLYVFCIALQSLVIWAFCLATPVSFWGDSWSDEPETGGGKNLAPLWLVLSSRDGSLNLQSRYRHAHRCTMQLASAPPIEPHAFNVEFCFLCRGRRFMRAWRTTFNIKYRGAGRFGANNFRVHIVDSNTYGWCKVFPPPVKIGPPFWDFLHKTIHLVKIRKWVGAWRGGLRTSGLLWCLCVCMPRFWLHQVSTYRQGFTEDIQ